jgi:hypothetical protein
MEGLQNDGYYAESRKEVGADGLWLTGCQVINTLCVTCPGGSRVWAQLRSGWVGNGGTHQFGLGHLAGRGTSTLVCNAFKSAYT